MPLCQRLAPQPLGIRHSVSRTFLGVAPRKTGQDDKRGSALDSSDRTVRAGYAREGCHRTRSVGTDRQIAPVLGSEEGFYGAPHGSRSVGSQSVHTMSFIQDDDRQVRASGPRPGSLGRHLGSEGRVLACSDKTVIPKLPSIQGGRSAVSLPSDAVRAEHRPSDLHQARIGLDKGVEGKGRKDLCLSR